MKRNILNRFIANCSEPDTTTRRSRVKRLVLCACVFACCVVSVLGVRAYNSRGPAPNRTLDHNSREPAPNGAVDSSSRKLVPDASLIKLATGAAQNAGVSPALPGVVITLGPNGFEPRTITHPVGRFALIFLDRTRLDGISLSFEGDSLTSPRRSSVEKRKPERIDTYDLSPGRYVLREENHPEWLCEITITPK
jgi:hypothetical protein